MTQPRWGKRALWPFLLLGCLTASGCRGCESSKTSRHSDEPSPAVEPTESAAPTNCTGAGDCADDEPCTEEDCDAGRCVVTFLPAGRPCDNRTVCDGAERCDGTGHCVSGPAPQLDDGNACTEDHCDPVRGVTHAPVSLDDSNACTDDRCDPQSGEVSHTPIAVDDGDDCTLDSCDPRVGVQHQPQSPTFTCNWNCEAGFHVSSRIADAECRLARGLRSVCMPNCGASFYTCDSCPEGYRAVSRSTSSQCGQNLLAYTFCQKDAQARPAGAPSR